MTHEMRHNKMLHTESRVARLFEINAVRRDPVNIDVTYKRIIITVCQNPKLKKT